MTELDRLAAALERLPAGGVAVLASLLKVAGSAYRGPGARMLVLPDDTTLGAISGGCLEKDIVAHAAAVREARAPRLVFYDLTRDDDAPWGLNMGCAARLDVLLEPIAAGAMPDWLRAALAATRGREPIVIATVLSAPAGDPPVGTRLLVYSDGRAVGTVPGALGGSLRTDALRVLREERSDAVEYPNAGGASAFVEFLAPPIAVAAFGDGTDAVLLAELAASLGWLGRVVRKGDADGSLDDRTAAIVMTHNFARDRELLTRLVASHARYVGVLGPRTRTSRLLDELKAEGLEPNTVQQLRIHAPAGLDLGAETPEEVSLAILAEVRAVFAGRAGGPLRDRSGPIHDRR
jgi:xanthine dehydrogenase accessory factor